MVNQSAIQCLLSSTLLLLLFLSRFLHIKVIQAPFSSPSLSFTNILPPLEKGRDFMQFRVDRRRESTDSEWEGRGRRWRRGRREEERVLFIRLLFFFSLYISDSLPFDLSLRQSSHGILSFFVQFILILIDVSLFSFSLEHFLSFSSSLLSHHSIIWSGRDPFPPFDLSLWSLPFSSLSFIPWGYRSILQFVHYSHVIHCSLPFFLSHSSSISVQYQFDGWTSSSFILLFNHRSNTSIYSRLSIQSNFTSSIDQ